MSSYQLLVVLASVRDGRFGPTVGDWFIGHAHNRPDVEVSVVDLAKLDLPADLSGGGDVETWAAAVAQAEAVAVVTPEYNHGYPGPLKTAIDSLSLPWRTKPVGFVSYGGSAGGQRAVEQLRPVFAELHAVTVRDVVSFVGVWEQFDAQGRLVAPEAATAAADLLLDRLGWWARATRAGRAAEPYQG